MEAVFGVQYTQIGYFDRLIYDHGKFPSSCFETLTDKRSQTFFMDVLQGNGCFNLQILWWTFR